MLRGHARGHDRGARAVPGAGGRGRGVEDGAWAYLQSARSTKYGEGGTVEDWVVPSDEDLDKGEVGAWRTGVGTSRTKYGEVGTVPWTTTNDNALECWTEQSWHSVATQTVRSTARTGPSRTESSPRTRPWTTTTRSNVGWSNRGIRPPPERGTRRRTASRPAATIIGWLLPTRRPPTCLRLVLVPRLASRDEGFRLEDDVYGRGGQGVRSSHREDDSLAEMVKAHYVDKIRTWTKYIILYQGQTRNGRYLQLQHELPPLCWTSCPSRLPPLPPNITKASARDGFMASSKQGNRHDLLLPWMAGHSKYILL